MYKYNEANGITANRALYLQHKNDNGGNYTITMQLIDSFMAVLAPHVCIACGLEGSVLCSECIKRYFEPSEPRCIGCMKLSENVKICSGCRRTIPLERVVFCSVYEGVSAQLIKDLKFELKRQGADAIASIMADTIKNNENLFDVISPIPTSPARVRARGFDHSELIAKSLAKKLAISYKNFFWRISDAHQVGANRSERFRQMKNVFHLHQHVVQHAPKSALLIDDVYTTGATLASATNLLKKSGVKHVSAIVFARKV